MPDCVVRGVVSVLSAPFDTNGDLVLDDVARQVEAVVSFGIAGVCLPAYGTEFYKLTDDERISVVAAAAEMSAGRVSVFGQANHDALRHAGDLARKLQDAGADHISFALPRRFQYRSEIFSSMPPGFVIPSTCPSSFRTSTRAAQRWEPTFVGT